MIELFQKTKWAIAVYPEKIFPTDFRREFDVIAYQVLILDFDDWMSKITMCINQRVWNRFCPIFWRVGQKRADKSSKMKLNFHFKFCSSSNRKSWIRIKFRSFSVRAFDFYFKSNHRMNNLKESRINWKMEKGKRKKSDFNSRATPHFLRLSKKEEIKIKKKFFFLLYMRESYGRKLLFFSTHTRSQWRIKIPLLLHLNGKKREEKLIKNKREKLFLYFQAEKKELLESLKISSL